MIIECRTSVRDEFALLIFKDIKNLKMSFGLVCYDFYTLPIPEQIVNNEKHNHYQICRAHLVREGRREPIRMTFEYEEREVNVTSDMPVTIYENDVVVARLEPPDWPHRLWV